MHAVVLAAGDGGRLQPLTSNLPKPLLHVRGRPMINHVLDALFAAGITDATIVVGYRGEQIRTALANVHPCGMTLTFVENASYDLHNGRSLWVAAPTVGRLPGFVLAMADHLVEADLVRMVLDAGTDICALAVERASRDDARADEATLALVRDGRVVDLGKGIADWNALDTGVFWCSPRVFEVMTPEMQDGECGAVFATLARQGELAAIDVTGRRWIDVDTDVDLSAAEVMLGRSTRRRIAPIVPLEDAIVGLA